MPTLLIDNDIFCKLGIAGLLTHALGLFGADDASCRCLASLPYMLRRGRLPRLYGVLACNSLIARAESAAFECKPSAAWFDKLTGFDRIDIGEAQLFAYAAEHEVVVLTGDKRALPAVAEVPGFAAALAGRVVTFEAVLMALCHQLGDQFVRNAVQPLMGIEATTRICFSPGNADPRAALRSYFDSLKADSAPLILWEPPADEG